MNFPRIIVYAIAVVVTSQAVLILAVAAFLLTGLFDARVDNKEVLAIIGPAFIGAMSSFATIMGALAGFIAGKDRSAAEGAPSA